MRNIDLFERIKIAAMTDAEKIALINRCPEYLKILSKDHKLTIRIRAKKKLSEMQSDQQARFKFEAEIVDLRAQAQSPEFSVRARANTILDRLRESGRIE